MSEINVNQLLAQLRATAAMAQGGTPPAETVQQTQGLDFGQLLKNSIDAVNETQQEASRLAGAFETGDPRVNLEQVMLAIQKANISFQAMTQVRNRLVTAYKEIMNMPV